MVKQTIQIFARVKPTKAKTGLYEECDDTDGTPMLIFGVPRELADGYVNNKKEQYKFRFGQVFNQQTKQDEIFDNVAKPVVDNVLEGYNGTIFAYGQTSSGKTFTITGGAERYVDRGIIPRTLSYIFDYFEQNSECVYTTHISYLEIYNENGYDLLDPKHEGSKLEDLPKVSLMEDTDQNIHLKNLSTHPANNEEDALNLLFLGDTNRMIAETPMNQASTRSHCVFTIHITSREAGSATIRRSKLHLVDLAGSERVGKTGVNGVLLTEAKYINLSLHYLEQVIVALSEKSRAHIPYRNSMMTSVLRDSLGGNCMTSMIATVSVEKKNIDESISTCRFAQRVALIKNEAILNEELDPKLMIARLKKEIQQLKEELAMATGEQRTDSLSDEELDRCEEAVKCYLEDNDPEATLNIGADMRKIQECFRLLKKAALEKRSQHNEDNSAAVSSQRERTPPSIDNPVYSAEANKLRELIQQRDNEINILVNMLKKEKKRSAEAIAKLEKSGISSSVLESRHSEGDLLNGHSKADRPPSSKTSSRASTGSSRVSSAPKWRVEKDRLTRENDNRNKTKILGEMSMGRQEAFEIFRRDYQLNQNIDDNKHVLKERYAEAKELGNHVNQSRTKINKLKSSIEQHRMSRVMQGLVDPGNPEPDDLENEMKDEIEEEKLRYKGSFNRLRVLKTEIEHLQHLLENAKVKLMKDFELWWAEQATLTPGRHEHVSELPPAKTTVKTAWKTPPMTPPNVHHNISAGNPQSTLISDSPHSGRSSNKQKRPLVATQLFQSVSAYNQADPVGHSIHGTQDGSYHRNTSFNKIPSSPQPLVRNVPVTGDAQADADIMAFVKARQNILQHTQGQGNR